MQISRNDRLTDVSILNTQKAEMKAVEKKQMEKKTQENSRADKPDTAAKPRNDSGKGGVIDITA